MMEQASKNICKARQITNCSFFFTIIFRQKLRKLDNGLNFALALTFNENMSDKTCNDKYPLCATSMAKPDSYRNVALRKTNVEETRLTEEALEAFNKVREQWSSRISSIHN